MSDEELDAISQRAAGNPLFLQELAAPEETEGDGVVPETVEALLATKIDRLWRPPTERSSAGRRCSACRSPAR